MLSAMPLTPDAPKLPEAIPWAALVQRASPSRDHHTGACSARRLHPNRPPLGCRDRFTQ